METWWGLEEAMDLLSTSRRLTLRASRVSSVVSRWPLDIDSSSASARLFQNRFRQPLRTANVQPKVVEKKTDFKGIESSPRPVQNVSEIEDLKNKLCSVQEENIKLQAVISELTQVNKRWQKYNSDRQIYVQKLLNTIQDQQEQLNKMGEHAFSNNEDETNSSSMPENINTSVKSQISLYQESERRLKEKIGVLEYQVKANREDWEAEHSEKKQAVKEKDEIENRVRELMSELQELKKSIIEKRLPKNFLALCQSCQSRFSYNSQAVDDYPSHSKLYRTAVHLPCSSQQWNVRRGSELAVDGKDEDIDNNLKLICDNENSGRRASEDKVINSESIKDRCNGKTDVDEFSNGSVCSFKSDSSKNITNIWNIGRSSSASENNFKYDIGSASYSRASTVPLVSSPVYKEPVTPSNTSSSSSIPATAGSYGDEPIQYQFSTNKGTMVTSIMQIPVAKSLSAPDSKSENLAQSFRSSLDSYNISPSSASAPISFVSSSEKVSDARRNKQEDIVDEGIETLTWENHTCPNCYSIFPPNMHIQFLDHFESCQR